MTKRRQATEFAGGRDALASSAASGAAPIGAAGPAAALSTDLLLNVEDLHVSFATDTVNVPAVQGFSLQVRPGIGL